MTMAETTPTGVSESDVQKFAEEVAEFAATLQRLSPATPLQLELAKIDAEIVAQAAEYHTLQHRQGQLWADYDEARKQSRNPLLDYWQRQSQQNKATQLGTRINNCMTELEKSLPMLRTKKQKLLDAEATTERFRLSGAAVALPPGVTTLIAQAQAAEPIAKQQKTDLARERDENDARIRGCYAEVNSIDAQMTASGWTSETAELAARRRVLVDEIAFREKARPLIYKRIDDAQSAWVAAVEQPAKVQLALASNHRSGLAAQSSLQAIHGQQNQLLARLANLDAEEARVSAGVEQARIAEIDGMGVVNDPSLVALAQRQAAVDEERRRQEQSATARSEGLREQSRPGTSAGDTWPNAAAAAGAIVGGFAESVRQALGRAVAR